MQNPYRKLSKINPQKENGHRRINSDIWAALQRYPFGGAGEYKIAMAVIDRTWGYNKLSGSISLNQFETLTGMSKPALIKAIDALAKNHVIVKKKGEHAKESEYLFNKHFDTWVGAEEHLQAIIPKEDSKQPQLFSLDSSKPQNSTVGDSIAQDSIAKDSIAQDTKGSIVDITTVVSSTILLVVKWPCLALASLYESIYKTLIESNIKDLAPEKVQAEVLNFLRKKLFEALKERTGGPSPVPAADAAAMTWMLKQQYSVDQIMAAYDQMKSEPFWQGKGLSMQSVKKNIAAIQQKGVVSHQPPFKSKAFAAPIQGVEGLKMEE